MTVERRALRAFLHGQREAERRQRDELAREGPRPAQAVAESLSALNAVQELGMWPGPRSKLHELEVDRVRRRWARIEQRAIKAKHR